MFLSFLFIHILEKTIHILYSTRLTRNGKELGKVKRKKRARPKDFV